MSKKHGEITIAIAGELDRSNDLAKLGYSVIYDHGKGSDRDVGVTSAWLGNKAEMDNRLSEIDITIIERNTNKAILLIEIEESGDNPKKIIGDVMATLLADGISSTIQPNLQIGTWTTLVVLGKGEGENHEKRIRSVEDRISELASSEGFNKLKIGTIKLALFQTQDDLRNIIMDMLRSHPQMD
jgi:hypothetical protein